MSGIDNVIGLLESGIKAEGLRQKTIANNIANMETAGYRRVDVQFKELLTKAMDSDGNVDVSKITPEVYQPENTPVKSNGNDVTLEYEIGEMVNGKKITSINLNKIELRDAEKIITLRVH